MSTVPYASNLPSSFEYAHRDDFFGFGNAMQAIDSITPKQTRADGTTEYPTQIITVSGSGVPPQMALGSSGGTFFDVRPPSEIFAEMDARLNQQRGQVLNSPQLLKMLEQAPVNRGK